MSFNPCYNGLLIRTSGDNLIVLSFFSVSILVIMDY